MKQNRSTLNKTSFEVKKSARLMDFLLEHLPFKSRNNIKSLLSRHLVLVNGAPVSQFDFEVVEGDIIEFSSAPVKKSKQQSKLKILYEDDELIAIDKPSGLLSVASDKEKNTTAYRLVLDYVRNQDSHKRIFVVHRIDKDTSGVLLFAKNEKLKNALQDEWNHLVKKRLYVAIVEGLFEEKKGSRTSWLLETKTNIVYSSSHKGDGLKATTNYEVIKDNGGYSLLNVTIDTGRKNQIRVHMKDLHHPIVGDNKYQSEDTPLKRLGLHAKELVITHPFNHQMIDIIAHTPKEFNIFMNQKMSLPKKEDKLMQIKPKMEKNKTRKKAKK